jgi:hypothetical protein
MMSLPPLDASEIDASATGPIRSRMIERLTLSVAALGLVVGLGSLIRDMPEAYAEGRLSSTRLSQLYLRPSDVTALASATRLPERASTEVRREAEALPPTTP